MQLPILPGSLAGEGDVIFNDKSTTVTTDLMMYTVQDTQEQVAWGQRK